MKKLSILPIKTFLLSVVLALITSMGMRDIEPPYLKISNGLVEVKLYLPDAERGFYRGTRFDWSGVIPSVEYKGHQYHGLWFDNYNPTTHDAIMGPVEEFGPLGYEEAKTGENFVKIGVGSLIKPDDRPYTFSRFYNIAHGGKRKIKKSQHQVIFTHSFADKRYAYEYVKTVRLTKGKPELVLLHTLKNKGTRSIQTTVYNHNFLVIDKQPTGPGYVITLPVNVLSAEGGKGVGEVVKLEDNRIIFLRALKKGEQGYFPDLAAGVRIPYNIKVENSKAGAGVQITGDREIDRMVFWSSSTNVSPEPYLNINVAPGKEFTWKIAYRYYSLNQ